mmetsp:Transcript_16162/g.28653  ORF Transcript_16162/g.28653 Transcript_16162/m.28653 type:complete len:304 (+) Transcript_16162:650-1561(+)
MVDRLHCLNEGGLDLGHVADVGEQGEAVGADVDVLGALVLLLLVQNRDRLHGCDASVVQVQNARVANRLDLIPKGLSQGRRMVPERTRQVVEHHPHGSRLVVHEHQDQRVFQLLVHLTLVLVHPHDDGASGNSLVADGACPSLTVKDFKPVPKADSLLEVIGMDSLFKVQLQLLLVLVALVHFRHLIAQTHGFGVVLDADRVVHLGLQLLDLLLPPHIRNPAREFGVVELICLQAVHEIQHVVVPLRAALGWSGSGWYRKTHHLGGVLRSAFKLPLGGLDDCDIILWVLAGEDGGVRVFKCRL